VSPAEPTKNRPVRSFVRRAGRITSAQKLAIETLLPAYGIKYSHAPLNLTELFGRNAPVVLEIGFGNGDLLCAMARDQPDFNFIGIEVHDPGVGHCLLTMQKMALTNIRVIQHDAVEVLSDQIPDESLARLNLFFPDPWPKKRHLKRRIVQPEFVQLLARKLKLGGIFHAATDWPPYAGHIDAMTLDSGLFQVETDLPADRPVSKFERRGIRLGHPITEHYFRRV
jgi:tRNA (guanine-N7-)-methyltransferase